MQAMLKYLQGMMSAFTVFPDHETEVDQELLGLQKKTVSQAFAEDVAKLRGDSRRAALKVYAES